MNLRANRQVCRNEGNSALRVKGRKLLLLRTLCRSDGGLKFSAEIIPPTHEYLHTHFAHEQQSFHRLTFLYKGLRLFFRFFLKKQKRQREQKRYIYIYTRIYEGTSTKRRRNKREGLISITSSCQNNTKNWGCFFFFR